VIYECKKEEAFAEAREEVHDPQLNNLCDEFATIFEEVLGLPPMRSHDHQITLLSGI